MVIPVRDRPEQLRRLLSRCEGLALRRRRRRLGGCRTHARRSPRRPARPFIALPVNAGPSAARNAGLAQVSTPFVAFIDSDCVPDEGWLEPLLGPLQRPHGGRGGAADRTRSASRPHPALTRYEAVRSSLDRGGSPGSSGR